MSTAENWNDYPLLERTVVELPLNEVEKRQRLAKLCSQLGESFGIPHLEACDYLVQVESHVPVAARLLAASLQLAELSAVSCKTSKAKSEEILDLMAYALEALEQLNPIAFHEWQQIEQEVEEFSISKRLSELEESLGGESVRDMQISLRETKARRKELIKQISNSKQMH